MELKQLNAFIAVAEEQSFSTAAESTGLSQPSLSRLIKQLEDELGVELLDRYHRPLQFTAAGEFFYHKLTTLLVELDTLVNLTQQIGKPSNRLTIGFVPSVLYGLLPEVIATLKRHYPDLNIHLRDISSYQQINALKSGEIDVGFGRFAHHDNRIKQVLLRHERYVIALPHSHRLCQQPSVKLSEVLDIDTVLILYHQTHLPKTAATTITEPLLHLFAQHGISPPHTIHVSDLQVALGLVAADEGVTLVPDSLKTLRSEQIHYRPILHENATTPIYLHTLADVANPKVQWLLNACYEVYETKGITYRVQHL